MESLMVEFDQFSRAVAKFLYLDGRYKSKKKLYFVIDKKEIQKISGKIS